MDGIEEYAASNDHSHIIKGKRTKRVRPSSPPGVAMMTSSTSSGGVGGGGGGHEGDYYSIPSPTTTSSGEIYESTEEEEDMANCLILLAQGVGPRQSEDFGKVERFSNTRKFHEMVTTNTAGNKAGVYVYECKTCNRSFPSFQALGGHRASHKKPKPMVEEKKAPVLSPEDDEYEQGQFNKINISPTTLSLQIANKAFSGHKAKVHECSICGSEFTSGQALGGHMRRHRTSSSAQIAMTLDVTSNAESSHDATKPRNILALDLNLPAPEDDHRDSKFQFVPTQQPLVFSAPALVDCHY